MSEIQIMYLALSRSTGNAATTGFSVAFDSMLLIKNSKQEDPWTSPVVRECVNHGDSGRKWFVRAGGGHTDLNTKLSTAIGLQ